MVRCVFGRPNNFLIKFSTGFIQMRFNCFLIMIMGICIYSLSIQINVITYQIEILTIFKLPSIQWNAFRIRTCKEINKEKKEMSEWILKTKENNKICNQILFKFMLSLDASWKERHSNGLKTVSLDKWNTLA